MGVEDHNQQEHAGRSKRSQEALKEYELMINLYMHEDNFMLRAAEIFILLNGALAAAAKFGAVVAPVHVILAVLGIATCYCWRGVLLSAEMHHDLRAYRARQIEAEMGWKGTFHNEQLVFHYGEPVVFTDLNYPSRPQEFSPARLEPVWLRRAFGLMRTLPIGLGAAWLAFLVYSVVQAVQR